MSTTSVATIVTTATASLSTNLVAILPYLIPAAIALAVFWLAVHWFFNAAGRR